MPQAWCSEIIPGKMRNERTSPSLPRWLRAPLTAAAIAAVLTMVAGCGAPRVPVVPELAREQVPARSAHPAETARGRMVVDVPGKNLSAQAAVARGEGSGCRLVVYDSTGILLFDASAADDFAPVSVRHCAEGLQRARPVLALMTQGLGRWPEPQRQDGDGRWSWRDEEGRSAVWGGDPLLPRQLEHDGWAVVASDYRWSSSAGRLVAHGWRAYGPLGITVTLTLTPAD